MRSFERRKVRHLERTEETVHVLAHDAGRRAMAARGNEIMDAQIDRVRNVSIRCRAPGQDDEEVHEDKPIERKALARRPGGFSPWSDLNAAARLLTRTQVLSQCRFIRTKEKQK